MAHARVEISFTLVAEKRTRHRHHVFRGGERRNGDKYHFQTADTHGTRCRSAESDAHHAEMEASVRQGETMPLDGYCAGRLRDMMRLFIYMQQLLSKH